MSSRSSFAVLLEGRDNNLNLIRLLAASLVTFSHAYPLTGNGDAEPLARLSGVLSFGRLAVFVFFVISGLLIARSFDRCPSLLHYFGARALRLYPALLAALLLCALPLGLWLTPLSPADYLRHPEVFGYVRNNLQFTTQYGLPGVFAGNPHPGSVNGSLWTLRYEVYAYFCVVGFGLLGLLRHRPAFNVVTLALILLYLKLPVGFLLMPAEWGIEIVLPLAGFLFGMAVYVNRARIDCRLRYAVLGMLFCLFSWSSPWLAGIFIVTVGYTVLVLAFHPRLQTGLVQRTDYSYGVYVYSFPVQQLLALLLPALHPGTHFMLAYGCVLLLAAASWHWLEKPALAWKRYLPAPAES